MQLTALTDSAEIEAAMDRWRQAFEKIGEAQTYEWQLWSKEFGVALSAGRPDSRYSYSLLNRAPSAKNGAGIVEINPPSGGKPQGNNQGVVAVNENGALLLLRRGRLSLADEHVDLRDYLDIHGLPENVVHWPNGNTEVCFLVCELGKDDSTIVANTASFMEACRQVRMDSDGATAKEIKIIKTANFIEETVGSYDLRAQDVRTVVRQHARLANALREQLEELGHRASNERVGRLGPDVFTVETRDPACSK